jgi:2-amino-4-hydroxy-6-hydroxymethyldihydropteridine diphosphokinase
LDILLLGELEIRENGLEIPHPRLAQRAFVLAPLNEIAPQLLIPGCEKTVAQLFAALLESSKNASDAVVQVESNAWLSR